MADFLARFREDIDAVVGVDIEEKARILDSIMKNGIRTGEELEDVIGLIQSGTSSLFPELDLGGGNTLYELHLVNQALCSSKNYQNGKGIIFV